jgi:hypothetical protein
MLSLLVMFISFYQYFYLLVWSRITLLEVSEMFDYIVLLAIAGVVAISASIHYMHKAGIDILDIHR